MDKIETHYDRKPIPTKNFDWTATLDSYSGEDNDPIGHGATERDAIFNLMDFYGDDMEDAYLTLFRRLYDDYVESGMYTDEAEAQAQGDCEEYFNGESE